MVIRISKGRRLDCSPGMYLSCRFLDGCGRERPSPERRPRTRRTERACATATGSVGCPLTTVLFGELCLAVAVNYEFERRCTRSAIVGLHETHFEDGVDPESGPNLDEDTVAHVEAPCLALDHSAPLRPVLTLL